MDSEPAGLGTPSAGPCLSIGLNGPIPRGTTMTVEFTLTVDGDRLS